MNSGNAICILAKCPIPGKVKPKFDSFIDPRQTALLARAFLMDTIGVSLKVPRCNVVLAYCPPDDKAEFEDIIYLFQNEEAESRLVAKSRKIQLMPQVGKDLGQKLCGLSEKLLNDYEYRRLIFVCSDNPILEPTILRAALELLKNNKVVLGPTFDGGFYLLGVNEHIPDLYDGIEWGSDRTYRLLMEKLSTGNTPWQELELSYDVDSPQELEQLYCDIENLRLTGVEDICRHTEKFLANIRRPD